MKVTICLEDNAIGVTAVSTTIPANASDADYANSHAVALAALFKALFTVVKAANGGNEEAAATLYRVATLARELERSK